MRVFQKKKKKYFQKSKNHESFTLFFVFVFEVLVDDFEIFSALVTHRIVTIYNVYRKNIVMFSMSKKFRSAFVPNFLP